MLRLIDFLKKDWEGQNLDLDRAEKWFAKRTPRLDTILEPYPNTIKKMWFEEIFTLREAAVSMITKVQEVEDNDTREALSDIWYRYHRETILGLVKICREETPKFRENPYVPEWFHIVLANELDRAFWNWTENKVGAFVTCSMPSQHSKSTIYAGGFVPLILGNCPHAQGILATYSENYAASVLKKDFAPTVYTDAYQKLFGKILKRHFNAKEKKRLSQEGLPLPIENSDKIGTIEGGILKGGGLPQITGNPAEFLLVDDPIKNREQADSPVEMKKLREEFFSSAMSRITSTTLVSVIHTRWTSDDIIGTLDDQQNMFTEEEKKDLPTYSHICFRARFDPTDEFEYDFRTYKNQDLYPSRFKAQYIRIFKGSDVTAQALLQQRPIDGHNSLIKREWINLDKHHLFPEKYAKVIISVDTSCNDGKDSDKMAVGVFGVSSSGHYYLLHLLYDRVTFTKALQGIEDVVKQYPNYNALLIETKSNGHGIYDILEKKYPNVVEAVSNDSKKARVHSTVPVLQGRKVHLPEGEVGSEYLEQLVKFKGQGKHEKDDLVDILTQTIIYCDALFREFGELSDIIPAKNMNKLKERSMWSKLQGDKKTFDKPSLALKHQHGKIFRF